LPIKIFTNIYYFERYKKGLYGGNTEDGILAEPVISGLCQQLNVMDDGETWRRAQRSPEKSEGSGDEEKFNLKSSSELDIIPILKNSWRDNLENCRLGRTIVKPNLPSLLLMHDT
jgi:hypothetical protein